MALIKTTVKIIKMNRFIICAIIIIFESLIRAIGERNMATIRDVAKAAGTSITTVSRVINNSGYVSKATRENVNKAIKEMDYRPNALARGLVTDITRSIGLILPDITNPYFAEIAKSIETVASKYNYNIFLCNTNWDVKREKMYLDDLTQKRVDGIIYAIFRNNEKLINKLENMRTPFVVLEKVNYENIKTVDIDNVYAGKLATSFLVNKGNKKIAFIGGPQDVNVSSDRRQGYLKCLENNNLEVDTDRIAYNEFNIKGGYEAMKEIAGRDVEIDSVFVAGDLMAIGAINFLVQSGIRVPEDVSVIGFDNIELAAIIEPTLTTVKLPIENIAEAAMKKIIEMIYKKDQHVGDVKIDLEVIERNSTIDRNTQSEKAGINLSKVLKKA